MWGGVGKYIYPYYQYKSLSSNISSAETDIIICLGKVWTVIVMSPIIWKFDFTDKIKQEFFQAVSVSTTVMKENIFTIKMTRRQYPAKTITDADYTKDLSLLTSTPAQAESLPYSLEQAAIYIGFHVNSDKIVPMFCHFLIKSRCCRLLIKWLVDWLITWWDQYTQSTIAPRSTLTQNGST